MLRATSAADPHGQGVPGRQEKVSLLAHHGASESQSRCSSWMQRPKVPFKEAIVTLTETQRWQCLGIKQGDSCSTEGLVPGWQGVKMSVSSLSESFSSQQAGLVCFSQSQKIEKSHPLTRCSFIHTAESKAEDMLPEAGPQGWDHTLS